MTLSQNRCLKQKESCSRTKYLLRELSGGWTRTQAAECADAQIPGVFRFMHLIWQMKIDAHDIHSAFKNIHKFNVNVFEIINISCDKYQIICLRC
jgi:hypothetical protein